MFSIDWKGRNSGNRSTCATSKYTHTCMISRKYDQVFIWKISKEELLFWYDTADLVWSIRHCAMHLGISTIKLPNVSERVKKPVLAWDFFHLMAQTNENGGMSLSDCFLDYTKREFHESNFRFVMCCTSIGTRKRQRHSWHRPSVTSRNRKRVANELN